MNHSRLPVNLEDARSKQSGELALLAVPGWQSLLAVHQAIRTGVQKLEVETCGRVT